jgi:membrane protein
MAFRPRKRHASDPPGKRAAVPSQFGLRDWGQVLARVFAQITNHHLTIVAAGVAFFSVLALFPAMAALVGIFGMIADPADIPELVSSLRGIVPQNAIDIIESQVSKLASTGSTALGLASLVALLLSLWSSRAGVNSLIEGLNIVYGEPEQRGFFRQLLVSLLLTLLMIAMALVALGAVVVLPTVLNFLKLGTLGELAARLLRWPILLVTAMFAMGALYRYGPNRAPARVPWVTRGAVAATLVWLAASFGFSYYVTEFGTYNEVYGSLGAAIILLLWIYISAFMVLLGGELNAEMELHTARDTTTGPEKPMGERGAYVADHVA